MFSGVKLSMGSFVLFVSQYFSDLLRSMLYRGKVSPASHLSKILWYFSKKGQKVGAVLQTFLNEVPKIFCKNYFSESLEWM